MWPFWRQTRHPNKNQQQKFFYVLFLQDILKLLQILISFFRNLDSLLKQEFSPWPCLHCKVKQVIKEDKRCIPKKPMYQRKINGCCWWLRRCLRREEVLCLLNQYDSRWCWQLQIFHLLVDSWLEELAMSHVDNNIIFPWCKIQRYLYVNLASK